MKEPKFGIDSERTGKIDWPLATRRVLADTKSDFIHAPHLRFIFQKAGDELARLLISELNAGTYSPSLPVHMEVPKSASMRTDKSSHSSIVFSRQGSILLPKDRLLLQALADQAAPYVGQAVDKERSFSHRLAPANSDAMFLATRVCWNTFQKGLAAARSKPQNRYVIKVDVVNYFGSINQHLLVNRLQGQGMDKPLSERLEALLVAFTGHRSSRGILQGLVPTDLLGEFYLTPTDRFLKERQVDSLRYVDDIYIFVETSDAAERLVRELIPQLRGYDLVINEGKCVFMPAQLLITEEPDLEDLFRDAIEEVSAQVEEKDFSADYGFQSEWDDEDDEDYDAVDLELAATIELFDSAEKYEKRAENIERFCLPLFAKAGSDYALDHVEDVFESRPSMAQIYAAYMSNFLEKKWTVAFLKELFANASLGDWQRMWVGAALLSLQTAEDDLVSVAAAILRDPARHEALRAVAAIIIGRFGDADRRTSLFATYQTVGSAYIQLAIFFASKDWPGVERRNAEAAWSQHSDLHRLLSTALKN